MHATNCQAAQFLKRGMDAHYLSVIPCIMPNEIIVDQIGKLWIVTFYIHLFMESKTLTTELNGILTLSNNSKVFNL